MEETVIYREMQKDDAPAIYSMVMGVFDQYIAPGFSEEGCRVFEQFVNPEAVMKRIVSGGSFIIIAEDEGKIVGSIEISNGSHIASLFVDANYHKMGIAKKLLSLSLEKLALKDIPTEITVKSSPFAVEIYRKLGFQQEDIELEKDGIRYTPMKKVLGADAGGMRRKNE